MLLMLSFKMFHSFHSYKVAMFLYVLLLLFRFRYGYRLERIEKITDPLKRIELFKAITSPAYIIATLENVHDVSSEFFCPVKKCFEFACEASAKSKAMPEYKREYQEIEHR